MSVAAVVLFHVCLWWYLPLIGAAWPPAERAWATVNSVLGSVRMPLLLAVSGLVSARRIRAGLSSPVNLARAAANVYLYVVWACVYAIFYALTAGDVPHRIDGATALVRQLAVPETTLWYLAALALYTVGLAAVHRVPAGVVLAVLAGACLASRALVEGPGMWPRIIELAVFFALGVYAAPWLRTFAARVTVPGLALCAACSVAATLAGRYSGTEVGDGLVFLVRGATFLLTALAVVVLAVRWGPLALLAQALGRRTLSVYVLHVPLIALLIVTTRALPAEALQDVVATPGVTALLPVVTTGVVVGASLLAQRALTRCGFGALFRTPDAVTGWVLRAVSSPPRRSAGLSPTAWLPGVVAAGRPASQQGQRPGSRAFTPGSPARPSGPSGATAYHGQAGPGADLRTPGAVGRFYSRPAALQEDR